MAFALCSIPFSHFADLVSTVGSLSPRKVGQKRKRAAGGRSSTSNQLQVVQNWINRVKREYPAGGVGDEGRLLPEGTVRIFLRLFFPEEGARRRYGMQETILANHLCRFFGIKEGRFNHWNAPSADERTMNSGCLGTEVERWMRQRGRGRKDGGGGPTIGRVDELLDELAAKCSFSAEDVVYSSRLRHPRRPTSAIISDLFAQLSPSETSLMVQLILRDISPILYTPPAMSGRAALKEFNSAAYIKVEVYHALMSWHPTGEAWYRVVKDLDLVGAVLETTLRMGVDPPKPAPVFGVPIQVPKSSRPGTCAVACKHLHGRVAVETKYDGERLQIHIDLAQPSSDQIRIFSKSTRESTAERRRLLPIIRAALSLPSSPHHAPDFRLQSRVDELCHLSTAPPPSRLIIEGEMVPYDESSRKIEEFWKLGHAKGGTDVPPSPGRDSQTSGRTGETVSQDVQGRYRGAGGVEPSLHLKIVWFDLLAVEDEVLLDVPFEERRARLTSLVQEITGYSKLADSVDLNFDDVSALSDLRLRFAHIITSRAEGLMLKPLASRYNDPRAAMRWVKLKKDFIPGAGDTLDFHIVGARWSRDRGRELLVPPSMYTTFYVGLRANELGARFSKIDKPHYHILFASSYGLSRRQLGDLDASIREKGPIRFDFEGTSFQKCSKPKGDFAVFESPCTSFTFSLAHHLVSANARPTIIFKAPRVFELNGAGFQRASESSHYELRWPRITKVDRLDGDPLSLSALQTTAIEAMRITSTDGSQGFMQLLWSKIAPVQAPETEQQRYDRELPIWIERLEKSDKVVPGASILVAPEAPSQLARPALAPLAPTMNRRDKRKEAPSVANLEEAEEEQENRPTQVSSLRIEETLLHIDIDLTTSPSPVRPPPRRPASPSTSPVRGSLPLFSPPPPPPVPLSTGTEGPPTSPTLKSSLIKRPRASCPSLLSSSDTGSSSSTIDRCTTKRRCGRTTLPLISSASVASTSASSTFPSSDYSWSIVTEPVTEPPPTPRHPFLDLENHLWNPLDVLWLAGWVPTDRSAPFDGPRRQGYLFVAEDQVDWLTRARGVRGGSEQMAPVWIVERSACETKGQWDMEEAILSVI